MKEKWNGFITGFITACLLLSLGTSALAASVKQLKASYNNIKITLDGTEVTPKDARGNAVEPFIVDGTTYLPVRAVADALGLGVGWNKATNTVMLTSDGSTPTAPAEPVTPTPAVPSEPSPTKQGVSYRITYQNCRLSASSISDDVFFDAIVEVENNGTENLYLDSVTFDFEDRNGHLLETKSSGLLISSDPDIIAPGEKGYFYGTGSLDKIGLNTDYVFKPVPKIEKAKNSMIRYAITDTQMTTTDYGGVKITGRVTNNTAADDMVWVAFILYRSDGTPIVGGGTNVWEVKAGATASFSKEFSASDLGVSPSEVASYKIYAEKHQYQF